MAEFWLLRHGDAEPYGSVSDAERKLTERGERQAVAAGRALRRLGIEFAAVLASPKVRARETARLLCAQLEIEPIEEPALVHDLSGAVALELLARYGPEARVLVVGHEPTLSQTVYDLTGGRVEMKKSGVAGIYVEGGSGYLLTLLRPKQLAALVRE